MITRPPDTSNGREWRTYLTERLSESQAPILERGWKVGDQAMKSARSRSKRMTPAIRKRRWMLNVLQISVQLKPAGRAVLRQPGSPYRVEIQWVIHPKYDEEAATLFDPKSVSIMIMGESGLWQDEQPDLNMYFTAFLIHRRGIPPPEDFLRAPKAWPAPGQPPDTDFYRFLLSLEESERAGGSKHAAKDIAERYGKEYSTVRTWLSRAHKYM